MKGKYSDIEEVLLLPQTPEDKLVAGPRQTLVQPHWEVP